MWGCPLCSTAYPDLEVDASTLTCDARMDYGCNENPGSTIQVHCSGVWEPFEQKAQVRASICIQRHVRGFHARSRAQVQRESMRELIEQHNMDKADVESAYCNSLWGFSKVCPRGRIRSSKKHDCRLPSSQEAFGVRYLQDSHT